MRTIDATLLSNQSALDGLPCRQVVIGTAPSTIDVSAYVLAYDYEEGDGDEGGLTLVLDNKDGYFNSLTGDKAYITPGAAVELKRGLTVAGTDYVEELPTCWLEAYGHEYEGGMSVFVLECLDWRGKLSRTRLSANQTWSATSATTIVEWILTQCSLTRASGSMTSTTLEFTIDPSDDLLDALDELISKLPEFLYPGLDAEIKWKDVDASDASVYTFGWNASHPVLDVQSSTGALEVNDITVKGKGGASGSATDATEIAAVGNRRLTIYDPDLSSNAECAQRAQAELDIYAAEAVEGTIICRPCHGLELYDVVKVDDPPWGGGDVTGRVIGYREEWNKDGRWSQVISLGPAQDKDPGNEPTRKRSRKRKLRRRKRSTRKRRKSGRSRRRYVAIPEGTPGLTPIGGIIGYHGAVADIPPGWALCDGDNGTYDLRGSFIIGAGGDYDPEDTGGAATVDLAHTHGPGTLATDTEAAHAHGPGTLGTDTQSGHTHGPGTLNTDWDAHTHDVTGSSASGGSHTHGSQLSVSDAQAGVDFTAMKGIVIDSGGAHTHASGSYATDEDSHTHDVDGGVTGSAGSHDHDVDSGVTGSAGSHDHDVDSGETASALSAEQDILPPWFAFCWIQRTE